MRRLARLIALPLLFDIAFAFMLSHTGDSLSTPTPRQAREPAYAVLADWDGAARGAAARTPAAAADRQRGRVRAGERVTCGAAARPIDMRSTPGGITLVLR